MAYCQGCGHYIGDYSAYRHNIPGKGALVLCYQCRHWAERHPGRTKFPAREIIPQQQTRRVRAYGSLYMMGAVGLFALGVFMLTRGNHFKTGLLLILGAVSLFSIGLGMRRFANR
ncbi:hypothetical protein HZA56_00455 [Candidatus Poribacteria bacterium]|nr:hypothetical protein [Candidatus Poribacteria bacterium]